MDDPGDTDEKRFLQMFPKLLMLIAIVLIMIFFSYFLTFTNINTSELEMNVFINRLLYSTNALAYYDEELGRSYLGRIDLEKLNSENLDKAINFSNNHFFAARISLIGYEPVYYHQALFERLEPLANAHIRGPGGADKLEPPKEFMVTFSKDGVLEYANLKLEVLRARS